MQCEKLTGRGQCTRSTEPGSHYCSIHTSNADQVAAYRISNPELAESVEHHAKASLYDLAQQLILLRGIIERRLNMAADDDASQISAFNFVAMQLVNLTKMTEVVVKLSKDSGALMEKSKVDDFVDKVIEIVSEELSSLPNHHEIVDRIVDRLGDESNPSGDQV